MALDDNLYLDNIEEYVFDENKIVTYKTLSFLLEVHVNTAKQMLFNFIQHQRNEKNNDDLYATYFIAGYTKSKAFVGQVVPEESLSAAKENFSTVISCHVYSVQGLKLKHASMLYNADYNTIKQNILQTNKFSAVSCAAAKMRSDDEMMKRKSEAQPTTSSASFSQTSKPTAKSTTPKTNAISSMFGKASQKNTDNKKSKPSEKLPENESKNGGHINTTSSAKTTGKQNALGFFSKQTKKPVSDKTPAPVKETTQKETSAIQSAPVKPQAEVKEVKGKEVEVNKVKPGDQKSKLSKTSKRPPSETDNKGQEKKRRRIQEVVWSESSSEEEEDEEPIPPTPPHERSPSPVPEVSPEKPKTSRQIEKVITTDKTLSNNQQASNGGQRRVKKRRLVSKHTIDEEGFMQTEKVYEDYSTDASESEAAPSGGKGTNTSKNASVKSAERSPPNKQRKLSPAKAANKQTSLMSFFKRK